MQESTVITISANDPCFPVIFNNTKPQVKHFYAKGNTSLLVKGARISIVGTRTVSPYGTDVTKQLTQVAVEAGLTVVSGLAFGVDNIAHKTALACGGKTIAVLPASLTTVYPASHHNLARQIVASGGLLISECHPEARPMKHYFIQRNRLIAALADQILITEAGLKSGARHTADFGMQLNKSIAAVPGNITNPLSALPNELIRDGAQPITSPQELLTTLKFNKIPIQTKETTIVTQMSQNKDEQAILQALSLQNLTSTSLMEATNLPPALFNIHITMLEINGAVIRIGNHTWRLAK